MKGIYYHLIPMRNGSMKSYKAIVKQAIELVYQDILQQGFTKRPAFHIGRVEPRMKHFSKSELIHLESSRIYMNNSSLSHARRDKKVTLGLGVPIEEIARFPTARVKMDLYYDHNLGTFLYVSGTAKYVINPKGRIKLSDGRTHAVIFVTASALNPEEHFNGKQYTKIEKMPSRW